MFKFAILAALPLFIRLCYSSSRGCDGCGGWGHLSQFRKVHHLAYPDGGHQERLFYSFWAQHGVSFARKRKTRRLCEKKCRVCRTEDGPPVPEDVTTPKAASKSTKVQAVLEPQFYDLDYETPVAPVAKAEPASETKSAPVANGLAANQPQWTLLLGTFVDRRSAIDLARRVKRDRVW